MSRYSHLPRSWGFGPIQQSHSLLLPRGTESKTHPHKNPEAAFLVAFSYLLELGSDQDVLLSANGYMRSGPPRQGDELRSHGHQPGGLPCQPRKIMEDTWRRQPPNRLRGNATAPQTRGQVASQPSVQDAADQGRVWGAWGGDPGFCTFSEIPPFSTTLVW